MVVTKRKGLTAIVFSSLLCIVAFQNCAVELSDQTYGAAVCSPAGADLVDFDLVLTTFFQSTSTVGTGQAACGTCHLTNSGNSAAARFGIQPGSDDASKLANFCIASSKASSFAADFLGTSHLGGIYPAADIPDLINWANSVK